MHAPEKTTRKLISISRSNSLTKQHQSVKATDMINNINKENNVSR